MCVGYCTHLAIVTRGVCRRGIGVCRDTSQDGCLVSGAASIFAFCIRYPGHAWRRLRLGEMIARCFSFIAQIPFAALYDKKLEMGPSVELFSMVNCCLCTSLLGNELARTVHRIQLEEERVIV
jgi:hypothetical protein